MRRFILVLALVSGAWSAAVHAGDSGTIYSELTFVDVAPGQEAAFRRQAAEVLAPLAQKQIDDGALFVWALYRVGYGGSDYDHVVIRQAIRVAGLGPVEDPDALWQAVHGRKDREKTLAELWSKAEVRERALYENFQFHTNLEQRERPWLTVMWVHAGPLGTAAFDAEMDTFWKPVLAEWVANGAAAAFSRYKVLQPSPTGHWHDQVLVTQFPGHEHLVPDGSFAQAFAVAHPEGDYAAAQARFLELADVVGTEAWELLELAVRRPPPDAM
jgi:hypothetical protein